MKILYLTQVFEVGQDPGSERHFYFCKYLVRHGHTAAAITSNVDYKQAAVKHPGQGWRVRRQIEGVEIDYVYSYANFRGSLSRRFWYYWTYLFATILAGLSVERPDVIYAVSTPLTVGLLGYCLSRLRGVPFVFEVTDIWPDAVVATGVVKNQILIRAAHWLEMFCYRKAAKIVVLGEGAGTRIADKGVPASKVMVITNGVDSALFQTGSDVDADWEHLRRELGFDNHFVCLYLGAHGAYNALWTIIDAAEALRDDPRYICVLIGDGDEKSHLQAMVQERGLTNVRFLPPVPRADTPGVLRVADVFLLPNRRGEFYRMNLPNKLFDFLASGRPIVVAGEGESGDLVQRAGAGRIVPAEDGAAMARAVIELASLSNKERGAMGESGRRYVLEHYNRDKLSQIFLDVLERVVDPSGKMP